MMTNSSLTRQVVLRHRAEGYLRFDLPPGLSVGAASAPIRQELEALDGVYRVTFHPAYNKLAIRFHAPACDLPRVARALSRGLAKAADEGLVPACEHCAARQAEGAPPAGLKARLMKLQPVRWVNDKVQEMRRTTTALQQLSLARFKKVPAVLQDPGKAFHEFLTDVMVLYLIRVHWDRITQQWLQGTDPLPVRMARGVLSDLLDGPGPAARAVNRWTQRRGTPSRTCGVVITAWFTPCDAGCGSIAPSS